MSSKNWMIYGAYGFTGDLVARRAQQAGLRPILAGRDAGKVQALADELGLPHRVFGLDDDLRAHLEGVALVLHCAGPFSATSRPMVDACLDAQAHYLDVTGEHEVIQAAYDRHSEALERGVVLMPAVGFDVVPTDCLAVKLADALPDAKELELAFSGGLKPSPGTAKTSVEGLDQGALARRGGELVDLGSPITRHIEFGGDRRFVMSIPWGDLASAYRSTSIENITVLTQVPPSVARGAKLLPYLRPVLTAGPVQRFLKRQAERRATGPSEEDRLEKKMHIWGRVRGPGGAVTATIDVPDGYELTVLSSLECAARILRGDAQPGAWTPGQAFGASLLTDLPGVGDYVIHTDS